MATLEMLLLLTIAFGMHVSVHAKSLTKEQRQLLIRLLEERLLDDVKQTRCNCEEGGNNNNNANDYGNDVGGDAEAPDVCEGDLCIMNPAKVQEECLQAHNKVRAYHNAPAMTWADEPSPDSDAVAWAKHLAMYRTFAHSEDRSGWGENIAMYGFMTDEPVLPCAKSVLMWYEEIRDYTGGFSFMAGHFTQVVWKASTKLHCGVAYQKGSQKEWYTVCRYMEPGNHYDQFDTQVDKADWGMVDQLKSEADLMTK